MRINIYIVIPFMCVSIQKLVDFAIITYKVEALELITLVTLVKNETFKDFLGVIHWIRFSKYSGMLKEGLLKVDSLKFA